MRWTVRSRVRPADRKANIHTETFRNGSRTYYNSSKFFPADVRGDVSVLYGFVRVADNYVDAVPQDADGFRRFVDSYRRAVDGEPASDPIIDDFVELSERKGFDPAWTDAFLYSMSLDLEKKRYETLDETLDYIYGSAEVIGLFMARIFELEQAADTAAMMLGRAMQYINFIRDIDEDRGFGRIYLPIGESSLPNLDVETARRHPQEFRRFVRDQIERYKEWQGEAEKGFHHMPRNYRIPVKTASDMYRWTAGRIDRTPFIVYDRKVKPARSRIIAAAVRNMVAA